MTPISEPARFVIDDKTGEYHPANIVAKTLAAQLSKRTLSDKDLLVIKSRGYRCTLTNGEPIITGVSA